MRRSRRGIILVMTLLVIVLVAMLLGATLALGPGSATALAQTEYRRAAVYAAQAGALYARVRLVEDRAWRGGIGGPTPVVNQPDGSMVVVEDQGNVVGFVTAPNGTPAQFRLRFNFQDGPGGGDGLDDPPAAMEIDHPYVSVNNLGSTAVADCPRADQPGWSVGAASAIPYQVPGSSAFVIVEGRAGPGLRDLDPADPNRPPSGRIATRVVETCFRSSSAEALDAAVMAAGDFDAVMYSEKIELKSKDKSVPPRIRTKGQGEVTDENGVKSKIKGEAASEVLTRTGVLNADYDPREIAVKTEDPSAGFYSLAWAEVPRADANPATTDTIHLEGGTYVAYDDKTLHYYDLSYEQYQDFMRKADPANALSWPDPAQPQWDPALWPVALTPASLPYHGEVIPDQELSSKRPNFATVGNGLEVKNGTQWRLKKDICVVASPNGVRDLAVVPRAGAAEGPPRPDGTTPGEVVDHLGNPMPNSAAAGAVEFEFKPDDEMVIVSTEGDLYLGGKAKGEGASLTALGSLDLVGTESAIGVYGGIKETVINLYAGGDLTINSYRKTGANEGSYYTYGLEGVLYSWGDVNFRFWPEDMTDVKPGFAVKQSKDGARVEVKGAVVAYGGDPAGGDPGHDASAGGNVRIWATNKVKFEFDSAYAGVLETSVGTDLAETFWATH
ncbi:MAG: hypothetical protein HY319_07150 [Armatimonadetes bacterium]|nr:hypothetical protein [Armatimonadota bacterium]